MPVFILDPADIPGGASAWWLHGSLAALAERLARLGAPLVLRPRRPRAPDPRNRARGVGVGGRLLEPALRACRHRPRQGVEGGACRRWFRGRKLRRLTAGRAVGNSHRQRYALQGLHAFLACAVVPRAHARTAARAEAAEISLLASPPKNSTHGTCAPRSPIGRRAYAPHGPLAKNRRRNDWPHFSTAPFALTARRATFRPSTPPLASRRISIGGKSRRARSRHPPKSPPSRIPKPPPASPPSCASLAGVTSRII